jgi:hypothetical protein
MRVERLEDILREQTVVYTRILVLFEFGELVLADVHHVCKAARGRGVDSACCVGGLKKELLSTVEGAVLACDRSR